MKKNKIIVLIIISIIIIIFVLGLYILLQLEKYTGLIVSIENDKVIIQSLDFPIKENENNTIDTREYLKYYSFSINEVVIKDSKGHEMETSKLKIGETINIYKIKEKLKKDIHYSIEPLYNVKVIKIIEKK